MKWIAIFALLLPAMCQAEIDGGFENVSESGGFFGWRADSSYKFQTVEAVANDPRLVRSGTHAVHLVQNDARHPGYFYTEQTMPVTREAPYTCRFFAKGKGQVNGMVFFNQMKDGGEAFLSSTGLKRASGSAEAELSDDENWHEMIFDIPPSVIPDNAVSMRLVVSASGDVYVDDASVTSRNATPTPSAAAEDDDGAVRPNLITLGLTKSAPTIDGTINDDEYAFTGGGLLNNSAQDLYPLPNSFHLSRDGERLYFAIQLELPDGYSPLKNGTQRDDAKLIAAKDALFLFFRADDDAKKKAYEGAYLVLTTGGAIYDAWEKVDWEKGSCARDTSFNADINAKTRLENGVWTAELSVPIKDLKIAAKNDAKALLSFGVNLQNSALAWQIHTNWFDHYQAFGELVFSDAAVTARMPTAGDIGRGQLAPTFDLNNAGSGEAPYELTYLVSTPRMVGGGIGTYVFDRPIDQRNKEIVADNVVYQWNPTGTLKAGESKKETTQAILSDTGNYVLEMQARAGGKAVAYQKIPFRYYPAIVGELTPVPSKDQLKASISLAGASVEQRGAITIDFKDKSGKTALTEKLPADGRAEVNATISMKDLPPGEYDVHFALATPAGNDAGTYVYPFKKWETPAWLSERAGIDALEPNWVPEPWTKVQASAEKVSVWGREFTFAPGALVAGITSQGRNILSSGAVLKYVADGKEHAIELSAPKIESQHDGRVVLSQTGQSQHFDAQVRQTIEFDGMNLINLTIPPKQKDLNIETMWLDVPFADFPYTAMTTLEATFWQHGVAPDSFYDTPRAYRWLWLGDDAVGCGIFFDNYKGWIVNSKKPRMTLHTKSKESRTVRLHLVNEDSNVEAPMEITFGLQASPYKKAFDNWRDVRPDGMGLSEPPANLVMPHASIWNSTDNKPSPRSWKVLEEMLALLHGRGQRAYPYLGSFFISPYDYIKRDFPFDTTQQPVPEEHRMYKKTTATRQEEFFYFAEDWLGTPRYIVENPFETRQEARVSPSSSWTDYFVYGIAKMLRRSELDGVYLDIQQPMTSYSEEKGHVWVTKDGVREGTAELLATRDFYKRMYRVFEQYRAGKHPWMMGHSFAANVPYCGFWDLNFNGEEVKPNQKFQFTAMTIQKDLTGDPMAILDPSQVDPGYNAYAYRSIWGSQFGIPNMVLPQYGYLPELNIPEHAREMLSLTFVHNSLLWPSYIPSGTVHQFWNKVEVPYGLGDAEFHPYFNNGIVAQPACVKVSYWTKPGDYLLAAANWSDQSVEATIELPEGLGANKQAINMETGQAIGLKPPLRITIPAHDLVVLRLTPSP